MWRKRFQIHNYDNTQCGVCSAVRFSYRTPEAARLLRELTVERPLAFQAAVFAELIRKGKFRPADPEALALAFWGPILAILVAAEEPGREPEAQRLLDLHLEHFRKTHSVGAGRARGRRRP